MSKQTRTAYRIRTLRKHALILSFFAAAVVAGVLYLKPSARPNQNIQKTTTAPQPSESELEKLNSLPYTNWSSSRTDVSKAGVVQFDRKKAFSGMNVYNSRNLSEAHLLSMDGKSVHSWKVSEDERNSWHTIHLLKDGSLYAIVKDKKLIKLSWDSVVEWEYKAAVHHDLAIANGWIYVLTRRPEMWITSDFRIPVMKEFITILNESGEFQKEIGLFEALSPFISNEQIQEIQTWAAKQGTSSRLSAKGERAVTWWENKKADVFHVNSIHWIEKEIPGVAEKGDLLLSVRQLDLVCIFRPGTGKLVWSWGPGEVECQHHATVLENQNILLFDNGCKRRSSRVIEVEPRSKKIVWQYTSSAEFFSERRGGAQRLRNGNTLITESDRGRIFEITPEGKIVWEFLNPDIDSKNKSRAVVYRMVRVPEDFQMQR